MADIRHEPPDRQKRSELRYDAVVRELGFQRAAFRTKSRTETAVLKTRFQPISWQVYG